MIICKTRLELNQLLDSVRKSGRSIGFVPTMGALHQGHLSLIEQSKKQTDFTIASIFVNPTQFNNQSDFENYPITLDSDCTMLESLSTDALFLPSVAEMYPEPDTRVFELGGLDLVMEGKFRPGHFNGVAQIVSKLFDFVQPDHSFFGQKDFQQLAIIRYMSKSLGYKTEIHACPIIRESDGLAMSSRNMRLSSEQRQKSVLISRSLKQAKEMADRGSRLEEIKAFVFSVFASDPEFKIEYFEVVDTVSLKELNELEDSKNRTACIAVFVGEIRLIDNYPDF